VALSVTNLARGWRVEVAAEVAPAASRSLPRTNPAWKSRQAASAYPSLRPAGDSAIFEGANRVAPGTSGCPPFPDSGPSWRSFPETGSVFFGARGVRSPFGELRGASRSTFFADVRLGADGAAELSRVRFS